MAGVESGLAAARVGAGEDDLVTGGVQQCVRVGDRVREQEVAEARGEELDSHALILTA